MRFANILFFQIIYYICLSILKTRWVSKSIFFFFSLFFLAIPFSVGQNRLVINLDKEKTEIFNFLATKEITTSLFYNIPQDKFLELQNDAIKITGTDSIVTSLKNY